MTFENAYAEWITKELNARLTKTNNKLTVKQSFETAYQVLKNNPDGVALVFNGGNASHSTVEGIDQNVMPLLLTVVCREINKIVVLNALNNLETEFNAVPLQMTFHDAISNAETTVAVKTTFNTPFVFDERDLPTRNATIKATYIQMNASVLYGANAFISPVRWQLKVAGVTYDIEHIAQYDLAAQPGYDEYVAQGSDRIARNVLSRCNSYHFVIYKVDGNNGLQKVFEKELLDKDGLCYNDITLVANVGTADETEIPITQYLLAEHYVNNAAAYELTLGR